MANPSRGKVLFSFSASLYLDWELDNILWLEKHTKTLVHLILKMVTMKLDEERGEEEPAAKKRVERKKENMSSMSSRQDDCGESSGADGGAVGTSVEKRGCGEGRRKGGCGEREKERVHREMLRAQTSSSISAVAASSVFNSGSSSVSDLAQLSPPTQSSSVVEIFLRSSPPAASPLTRLVSHFFLEEQQQIALKIMDYNMSGRLRLEMNSEERNTYEVSIDEVRAAHRLSFDIQKEQYNAMHIMNMMRVVSYNLVTDKQDRSSYDKIEFHNFDGIKTLSYSISSVSVWQLSFVRILVLVDFFSTSAVSSVLELMGKKGNKKARSAPKERRVSSGSTQSITWHSNPGDGIIGDGVLEIKDRKPCTHIDNGVYLAKISSKIRSLESVRCEDCREGALDRRESKGRSKRGKKKGVGDAHAKSESKSIWVCLECGHFACGGVGFPRTPQTHAFQHFRQTCHSFVMQLDNPNLCWCFPCNSLIPVGNSVENGERKDILLEAVKLIKRRSSEEASMDIEDVWFGDGKVASETMSENAESIVLKGNSSYFVRGFVNLGNTCFFNSVMQNLLTIERLRDYFMKLDLSVGPLTMALKKLFSETSPGAESRNLINPRTFFGCISSKFPQFRGYQQQDSHELLRCLLDGLCTEELGARNLVNSSGADGITSNHVHTFVDTIFGGQLVSTVYCVECKHSSIVYEPFLDLSLPVPIKKPSSKKVTPVSRARKQKMPLKKGGKTHVKRKTDATPVLAQCVIVPSKSSLSSCQLPSTSAPAAGKTVVSSDDFSSGPVTTSDDIGPVSQNDNISVIQDFENKQVFQNVAEQVTSLDDFAWLDYIEPGIASDDHVSVSQNIDILIIQDSENKQVFQKNNTLQNRPEPLSQEFLPNREPNLELDFSCGNSCEDELHLRVQGSKVLLLPCKEENSIIKQVVRGEGEASSSVVGCQEDLLDFDGLGDLFNEPEMVSAPSSCLGNNDFQAEVAETGFLAGHISESDPDEVDNMDAPVSVDSCLAYFTKPELLSNEHAWHCENCSKILRGQRMDARKNRPKTTSKTRINGGGLGNGKTESDTVSTATAESLVPHAGRLNDINRNCAKHETSIMGKEMDSVSLNPISHCQASYQDIAHPDKDLNELNNKLQELLPSSDRYKSCSQESLSDQASDLCSVNEPNSSGCNLGQVQGRDSQLLARECESDGSECEEMDSESVKVKRNATKRILINRLPLILTIHLKRFSQDARGRLSKLSGHVNFRDTVDLRPYMEPRCSFHLSWTFLLAI
ncbi:hypothetical protein HHK36_020303 [Tetracentron sinense]|uniref:ubiquitinyl hydrolase 1 n=1 Tax=Tetracentron sinense TaxID=13715 RepID=A0A835D7W6_TETSI|nr:hypothetical protein HHK36_020303 [Tetracentron sinense]